MSLLDILNLVAVGFAAFMAIWQFARVRALLRRLARAERRSDVYCEAVHRLDLLINMHGSEPLRNAADQVTDKMIESLHARAP